MANKRRRTPRLSKAQRYRPGATARPVKTAQVKKRAPQPTRSSIPTDQQLQEEYHYVITDLKRIGILALVMLVLLIVLALVLV